MLDAKDSTEYAHLCKEIYKNSQTWINYRQKYFEKLSKNENEKNAVHNINVCNKRERKNPTEVGFLN